MRERKLQIKQENIEVVRFKSRFQLVYFKVGFIRGVKLLFRKLLQTAFENIYLSFIVSPQDEERSVKTVCERVQSKTPSAIRDIAEGRYVTSTPQPARETCATLQSAASQRSSRRL